MIGIILAGGSGTRLAPITNVFNKHILPLYDKPVIYYSISLLMSVGIREMVVVCNQEDYKSYRKLLGNGSKWGIIIHYVYQKKSHGLLDGVMICKEYIIGKTAVVILGDNFFYEENFSCVVQDAIKKNEGATMFGLKKDYDYLITTIEFDNQEKPKKLLRKENSKNEYISPGLFIYDEKLYEVLSEIKARNTKNEWVEVNKKYLENNKLNVIRLKESTYWFDVGMPDTRLKAEMLIHDIQEKERMYVGCIEEIAYTQKWISKIRLEKIVEEISNCKYGKYLHSILLKENSNSLT